MSSRQLQREDMPDDAVVCPSYLAPASLGCLSGVLVHTLSMDTALVLAGRHPPSRHEARPSSGVCGYPAQEFLATG